MYIVRPLDHPLGWSVGASFRTQELPKLFAGAGLGPNAIGALIDTRRGNAQAVIGPAARRPKTDLSKTVLYSMMQRAESGIWIGPSEIDSIERVNAYRKVAGRDMVVLVGANLATIMEPAENLASATRALAFVANIMMVAVGGLVLWELSNIRSNRRQKRAFDRTRGEVQRLRDEEAANLSRTALASGRLAVLMETTPDGIALFDTEHRLMQWNSPFALGTGIGLRAEMPVDHLVRELAARGVFGPLPDFESAILQRAAILAAGDPNGIVMVGPDGKALQMRGLPVPQGGFMIMLGGAGSWEEMPEAPPLPQQAAVAPQPPPAVAETYRPPVAPVPEPPPAVDW
jgi:PAS domain-containing protein